MMMIHDPSSITIGTAAAHKQNAAALDKLANNYAAVYAAKSGKSVEDARAIMLATTYLSADEALAQKFATDKIDAAATAMASFDYRSYGGNTPDAVMKFNRTAPAKYSPAAALARMRMRMRDARL
jgi:hypothetical protein